MADSLYGVKQASKTKAKDFSSSKSLAFSTNLASLISSSSTKGASTGRARPSKNKPDIFTAHNKNVKKRSAADLENTSQRHQTEDDIGTVDASEYHRSKRKLEDKARLYKAMKRGEYIGREDFDDRGLVDFDKKWAEAEAKGSDTDLNDMSDSEDAGISDQEIVEYTDEFGRLRKGTKKEAQKEERRRQIQANATAEAERLAARPIMPTNIIYGDTVQHSAFNPDQVIADRMADLAKKRDKSATPPPDTHYDAKAEIRNKGTGFYGFSKDADERKREMDELEKERIETERVRKEREEKRDHRKKEIEERKKLIAEQRAKAQAEKFLNELDIDNI